MPRTRLVTWDHSTWLSSWKHFLFANTPRTRTHTHTPRTHTHTHTHPPSVPLVSWLEGFHWITRSPFSLCTSAMRPTTAEAMGRGVCRQVSLRTITCSTSREQVSLVQQWLLPALLCSYVGPTGVANIIPHFSTESAIISRRNMYTGQEAKRKNHLLPRVNFRRRNLKSSSLCIDHLRHLNPLATLSKVTTCVYNIIVALIQYHCDVLGIKSHKQEVRSNIFDFLPQGRQDTSAKGLQEVAIVRSQSLRCFLYLHWSTAGATLYQMTHHIRRSHWFREIRRQRQTRTRALKTSLGGYIYYYHYVISKISPIMWLLLWHI